MQILIYLIYDILVFLAGLVYLFWYALRGRVHAGIFKRLGFFKKDDFKAGPEEEVVWIHAVSVGEVRASESLLYLIRKHSRGRRVVISTVTPTGLRIAKKITEKNEGVIYAPLDISCVVERFIKRIRPSLLLIMETELWPNLIRLSQEYGCRVIVVNGRISDRSYRRYRRMRLFLKFILRKVDFFCMQNEEAFKRIVKLGVPRKRIRLTGNIKFDISGPLAEPSFVPRFKEALEGVLFCIAGSTHDNEEEMLIRIYKSLRKDFSKLRLMIAPRHLERLDKIRRMVRLQGLEAVNASRITETSSGRIILLDTVGDLSALYRFCDLAFIGGSLVKKGGHNPIEPAVYGKPILFGRHMDNFKEIRDIFVREKAAMEVGDPQRLEYELRRLLASASVRRDLGERAKWLIDKNKGAAKRTFACVEEVMRS